MNLDDQRLMQRCQQGDLSALGELVRRWQHRLAGSLGRLVTVQADVDDLCQEVFVRVLVHRHRYTLRGAFSTWLYRIALNVARDHRRRQRLRQHAPLGVFDAASDEPAVLDTLSDQEAQQRMHQALDMLDDELREALVLKHFGGLTFAEVAEATGRPASTIKSQVQRALEMLRKQLSAAPFAPEVR